MWALVSVRRSLTGMGCWLCGCYPRTPHTSCRHLHSPVGRVSVTPHVCADITSVRYAYGLVCKISAPALCSTAHRVPHRVHVCTVGTAVACLGACCPSRASLCSQAAVSSLTTALPPPATGTAACRGARSHSSACTQTSPSHCSRCMSVVCTPTAVHVCGSSLNGGRA